MVFIHHGESLSLYFLIATTKKKNFAGAQETIQKCIERIFAVSFTQFQFFG